ncbi:MAG: DNA methylase [Clostridia bacterium]|nr:DNA methylase [Clostridia bacterium]MBR5364730.1 DNA methylase [Clostridia bacterium]
MTEERERTYLAIDLKSFYASVECVERGLDPLTTNLVVADESRTEKTICLAVSPSLKSYGIPGRARLFEVNQKIRAVNAERRRANGYRPFRGKSVFAGELTDPSVEVDFLIARPQMARYMEVSAKIYAIYLRFVAPEDIHVYSVDEVFIDATTYLDFYHLDAHGFARKLVREVLRETGITATCGIGTNLYLAKIAMDIVAKKMPADEDGVRIASLDEMRYRRELWEHRPLTDFWRVGRGISAKLEANGLHTMGDVARISLYNEDKLYKLFGVNAELLIDHAWGWEPCTLAAIKAYKPESNSISSGQVLAEPYPADKGRLIALEMTDVLVLDLVDKGLVCDQMVLTVCYEGADPSYTGATETDWYGRRVPKAAHGSANLGGYTSSTKKILEAVGALYDRIVDPHLSVRRMFVVANHAIPENEIPQNTGGEQIGLFADIDAMEREREAAASADAEEKQLQKTVLGIKKKFGKNAILKGMNFEEGATTRERNRQVGGHKA